jgi:PKD repeat protein
MESDDQGAIAIYSANSTNLEIENNTIYQYDYAFISDNATAILKNIIAWDESPTDEPITIAPEVDVSYSDISTQSGSVYSGTGNINQNPQFYLPKQGDFRLQTGSPCIDSGDPSITDPDGSVSDMGRYFAPDLIDFDSQSMFGSLPNHNVQFTQKSVGFNTNNTTWEWDVNNDGVYDISGINPTYNFTSAGIYTVKLRVTKYSTVDSLTKEKFIVIQSQQLPAPDNVQISVSNSDITLSWDPISWPNGSRGRYYIIYKSDNPNNDFEYLAYTNDTPSYTDTNAASDVRAFYKIIAYSGNMRGLNFFIQKHRFLNKTSIQKER